MTHRPDSKKLRTDVTLLEVENLRIDIPVAAGILRAVRGIGFSLCSGETIGIVGESGCGKTLTALALMKLLPKGIRLKADKMTFGGTELMRLRNRAMADIRGDRIAMIFQDPMTSLNPAYTVGNQLVEILQRHRRTGRAEARDRAVYLLEKTGIPAAGDRLRQYPHQLSGGLRQRVMIAMALMCDPELLIADEPTTALDVTIQAQILLQLIELQQEFNTSMILITHDLGVVARVVDRVAVMYAGKIVETGLAQTIFKYPLHPYTQGLMSCIPVPGKTKPGEHLGTIPGMVPTLVGNFNGCSFANRCPWASKDCSRTEPPSFQSEAGHIYWCLMQEESCRRNFREVVRR
jgi:peptide/nickel transport system ATP-binding protein